MVLTIPFQERTGPHLLDGRAYTNKKPIFGLQVQHPVGDFPGTGPPPPRETDRFQTGTPYLHKVCRYRFREDIPRAGGWVSSARNCARALFFASHVAGEAFGAGGVRGWAFSPAEDAGSFGFVVGVGSSSVTVVLTVERWSKG